MNDADAVKAKEAQRTQLVGGCAAEAVPWDRRTPIVAIVAAEVRGAAVRTLASAVNGMWTVYERDLGWGTCLRGVADIGKAGTVRLACWDGAVELEATAGVAEYYEVGVRPQMSDMCVAGSGLDVGW